MLVDAAAENPRVRVLRHRAADPATLSDLELLAVPSVHSTLFIPTRGQQNSSMTTCVDGKYLHDPSVLCPVEELGESWAYIMRQLQLVFLPC